MHRSKLFQLLQTFKNDEWKSCRAFIVSESNEESELVLLFDYAMKYRKDLSHPKLAVAFAKSFLFKQKTDKNFRNLMSRLHGHVLDYMAIDMMRQDEREMRFYRIQSLNRRGLFDYVTKEVDQVVNGKIESKGDFWDDLYNFKTLFDVKTSSHPYRNYNKQYYNNFLDSWISFISTMNFYLKADAENIFKVNEIKIPRIDSLSGREAKHFGKESLPYIMSLISGLSESKSEAYFDELFDLIRRKEVVLHKRIGGMIIAFMIAFQNRQIRSGKGSLDKLVELFEIGLEAGWLLKDGVLPDWNFELMIHASCFSKDSEKSTRLLEKWKGVVGQTNYASVICLSQCTIDFYKGNNDNSIRTLQQHSFVSLRQKRAARTLLLMNLFVVYHADKEFMKQQITNYRAFIRKNNKMISKRQVSGALNFASILWQLVSGHQKDLIRQRVEEESQLIRRSWLRVYLDK